MPEKKKDVRAEALQMSRDLISLVEQQKLEPASGKVSMNEREKHLVLAVEIADQARELASVGEYQGASAYARVAHAYAAIAQAWGDYEPAVPEQRQEEAAPLPEWCGQCDGPEPGQRWVNAPVRSGEENYEPRLMRCPRCDPRSPEYQAERAEG